MSTPALAPAPAPLRRHRAARSTHGLTLLELLVALTIMALSLGVLYRASGSGARNAGELYEHQRALLLAQSLLAARDAVPENGWNESGESAGYQWAVRSQPYAAAPATAPPGATVPPLHELELSISWRERGQDKLLQLRTLRPQRLPVAAQGMP